MSEPSPASTYQVRLYVTGVHTLECQATSPDEARSVAETLWWSGARHAFHVDDVLRAAPDIVCLTSERC